MFKPHQNYVVLKHSFVEAYNYLLINGPSSLWTHAGTKFISSADISQKGKHKGEKVIRFFQEEKEFGRAYNCCWSRYYNCNRTRIGMYCFALDDAF